MVKSSYVVENPSLEHSRSWLLTSIWWLWCKLVEKLAICVVACDPRLLAIYLTQKSSKFLCLNSFIHEVDNIVGLLIIRETKLLILYILIGRYSKDWQRAFYTYKMPNIWQQNLDAWIKWPKFWGKERNSSKLAGAWVLKFLIFHETN